MRSRLLVLGILVAAFAACVTINVYFPEAAVKDLSEQIEEEIRTRAEEQAGAEGDLDEPKEFKEESAVRGGGLDLLFGVTPAHAQDVPKPQVSNPAIRKIIDSRAERLPEVDMYKRLGAVGENNKGLLEVIKLDAITDLRERAEAQRVVKSENADRETLYKEIAAAEGVDASQIPRIRETYAETLRNNARRGDWIQSPGGQWAQKK
jgi:uncharacterized protein YdbL (DUF1318 family)